MNRFYLLPLAAALFISGCNWGPHDDPDYTTTDTYAAAVGSQLADANSRFALKSFQKIVSAAPDNENIFYSPLSVSLALGMIYNGADGSSADAMRAGMELGGLSLDQMNQQVQALTSSLENCDASVRLNLANSAWVDNGFTLKTDYAGRLTSFFRAQSFNRDLQSSATLAELNGWVSSNTGGKIPIMYDQLPNDALLVLLNALYFKASWKYRFDARSTYDSQFHLLDGSTTPIRMMTGKVVLKFHEGATFQSMRIPYGRDVVAMYVLLPNEQVPVDSLIAALDPAAWDDWMGTGEEFKETLQMPKFKLSYEIPLNSVLQSLGMGIILTPGADLSKIAGAPGDLMVTEVKQKAFVEVNEEGTEAAAATGGTIGPTAPPPAFTINRPFFFLLRDDRSKTILFMGRIMNPQS